MLANKKTLFLVIIVVALIAATIWFMSFSRVTPPNFSEYPAGPERKTAFFSYFAPLVAEVNQEILADRARVLQQCEANPENPGLSGLAEKYRIEESDIEKESLCTVLKRRADIVPASLALAQAANESAWGTSRFAQMGNNFFGQWCYVKGCGIVPSGREDGKVHEVADFRSPRDSVASYMRNLNSHYAYKQLRTMRQSLRAKEASITGIELSHALNSYSERGEEYGKELRDMIRFNKLTQYD